jgi:hypothetical protein
MILTITGSRGPIHRMPILSAIPWIAELSSPSAMGLARQAAAVYSIFDLENVDPRVRGRDFA